MKREKEAELAAASEQVFAANLGLWPGPRDADCRTRTGKARTARLAPVDKRNGSTVTLIDFSAHDAANSLSRPNIDIESA